LNVLFKNAVQTCCPKFCAWSAILSCKAWWSCQRNSLERPCVESYTRTTAHAVQGLKALYYWVLLLCDHTDSNRRPVCLPIGGGNFSLCYSSDSL